MYGLGDDIRELEAEVERLRKQNDDLMSGDAGMQVLLVEELRDEVERLRDERDDLFYRFKNTEEDRLSAEAEVERLKQVWEEDRVLRLDALREYEAEVERLRAIETAARVAVTSWDADGVIFPSQVDSIRAALAKEDR